MKKALSMKGLIEGVGVGIGGAVGVGDGVGLGVKVGSGVGVTVGWGMGDGSGVGVGVGVRVGELVGVGEGSGVGVAVGSGVGVGEGSMVGVGVGDGSVLGVGDGSVVGVGEGVVRAGSIAEEEFCGSGVSLRMKSAELLSESSPFPASRSIPAVMDSTVERELALRSMLFPDAGEGAVAVSEWLESPVPTRSIRALELLKSRTVLLAAIALLVAE